jgi:hypothetical protein
MRFLHARHSNDSPRDLDPSRFSSGTVDDSMVSNREKCKLVHHYVLVNVGFIE